MRWSVGLAVLVAAGCDRPFDPGGASTPEPPMVAEVAAAAPACELAAAPPERAIQHVLIISEDGLRPDALSEERTPAHFALMRAGTTARLAETILPSETLPSHASMLSGYPSSVHK